MKHTTFLVILTICLTYIEGQIEFDIYHKKPTIETRVKRSLQSPEGDSEDSIVLYKFLDGEYFGLIGVGSPSKTFKVIFDTTWADIWLPSSHCSWTEIVCQLHTKYDSSASSSYIPNGTFINLTSDELSLMGILSTDTFHLPHVKVENQTFLEATHISLNPFIGYQSDGIVGLAYDAQSGWQGGNTFLMNLVRQNVIQKSIFTFYMNRDETTEKAGKIIFGGGERKHVKPNTIVTLKVVEKKFWQIQMDSVLAVKNKTSYPISSKYNAIFDTSSNVIAGPMDQIQKLNYMLNAIYLPGIKRYTVSCRNYAKLPAVHFILNGNAFILESKYYVQRFTTNAITFCLSPFVANGPSAPNYWMLGGAFMMEFYTEFDMDNNVVNIGETIF